MNALMEWGIQVIGWLQQASPTLDWPFRIFTFMGEEEFFLLLLPLIYWCLDRRTGARLTVAFLLCAYINALAKTLVALPRPADYAPGRVRTLWEASGYGFPSGHTQSAVVVWGYLASQFRRWWLWALAAVLMLFIPLSRIYLGVHFPHDVLGGYLIGFALLLLYLWLEPRAETWLTGRSLQWQLGLAIGIPLFLIFLFPTEDGVTEGATLMGMAVGFVLERRWVRFEATGPVWQRALRFLLGVIVLFALWMGLRVAFAALQPALLFRFIRYGLVGLWGGLGAPWVFRKWRLA
ncbi:MAG: phosphatase PAP2 family protein [Anaerolineae bacterium]|nr:phosphatase PAP2 family protein [Anaerolineae bacterium]MCX8066473.1 phosphatase PAP2 family protein [Anaerolineae bacterium]MDW7992931.1 phosphatase PAP2 family protein [Anaerolineae bacterium]